MSRNLVQDGASPFVSSYRVVFATLVLQSTSKSHHSISLFTVFPSGFQKKTGTTISNSAGHLRQTPLYNLHEDVQFLLPHIPLLEEPNVQRAAGTASTPSPSPPARAPPDGAQKLVVSTTRTGMRTNLQFPPSSRAGPR